jgi:hypothetical protein
VGAVVERETWARPMNTLPNILPETEPIRVRGITGLKGIADELNRREILTANGGRWYATRFAHDSSLEETRFELIHWDQVLPLDHEFWHRDSPLGCFRFLKPGALPHSELANT